MPHKANDKRRPSAARSAHQGSACHSRRCSRHPRHPPLLAPPSRSLWQPQQQRRRAAGGCRSGADVDQPAQSEEVSLSQLQQQLDRAIEDEEYEVAAELRDTLQRRRTDGRLAVEEANERFYAAFQAGSLSAMSQVWGKGEHVQCIHPLSGCIAGRQAVMESWKLILGSGRMKISLEDVRVFASENQAFVTCLEITETDDRKGRIIATNVFEKQGGEWKLVHHHGGPVPPGAR